MKIPQLLFFVIILLPAASYAAGSVDLGEIVVEDSSLRNSKPSLDSTSAATVLIPDDSKLEAQSIPELLEEAAGVHVKRYGRLDNFSALSIRGSSSGQVQIYLDDIPLMTSQSSVVDVGIVPMDAIERVEVYRGGSPGALPQSTIGGVILLKSKGKPEKRTTSVSGAVGSFETIRGRLNYAQNLRIVSPVLSFEHLQSKGDFTYKDDNGTRTNTSDDRILRRENNDFASNSLFTKFIFDLPGEAILSASNIFFQKEEGVPGLGSRMSLNARLATLREIAAINIDKKDIFTKKLDGHGSIFFDYLDSQFSDPDGEIGLSAEDSNDKIYSGGPNFSVTYDYGAKLTGFVSELSEFYAPYDRLATPTHGPKSTRHTLSMGLENNAYLFHDRLNIVPSVRVENIFNEGNLPTGNEYQLSAKLGLALRLVDELYLKSNVYRGFRNPTFTELFGDRGALQGNSSLVAEKAINFDAGLSYDFPVASWFAGGHIEATYFLSDANDLIQYVQTSNFTAKAMNMNDARIQGVEAMANAKFLKRFRTTVSYTLQLAKDISNHPDTHGKYLPGRPKHELYALVGWDEEWLPWIRSGLFCDMRYMSGNYLDMQNLLRVDNRIILGAGASIEFIKRFTASFSVQNISNDRISDIIGYPLPGRAYWGMLEVKI